MLFYQIILLFVFVNDYFTSGWVFKKTVEWSRHETGSGTTCYSYVFDSLVLTIYTFVIENLTVELFKSNLSTFLPTAVVNLFIFFFILCERNFQRKSFVIYFHLFPPGSLATLLSTTDDCYPFRDAVQQSRLQSNISCIPESSINFKSAGKTTMDSFFVLPLSLRFSSFINIALM